MQERVESGFSKTYIEHQPIDRFVINTHAFHNSHLLRASLPRSLIAPVQLYRDENRVEKHYEIARGLQTTQEGKRTAAKARAALRKQEVTGVGEMAAELSNKRTRIEFETGQAELDHA